MKQFKLYSFLTLLFFPWASFSQSDYWDIQLTPDFSSTVVYDIQVNDNFIFLLHDAIERSNRNQVFTRITKFTHEGTQLDSYDFLPDTELSNWLRAIRLTLNDSLLYMRGTIRREVLDYKMPFTIVSTLDGQEVDRQYFRFPSDTIRSSVSRAGDIFEMGGITKEISLHRPWPDYDLDFDEFLVYSQWTGANLDTVKLHMVGNRLSYLGASVIGSEIIVGMSRTDELKRPIDTSWTDTINGVIIDNFLPDCYENLSGQLVKLDENGDINWIRRYRGRYENADYYFHSAAGLSNGDIVAVGQMDTACAYGNMKTCWMVGTDWAGEEKWQYEYQVSNLNYTFCELENPPFEIPGSDDFMVVGQRTNTLGKYYITMFRMTQTGQEVWVKETDYFMWINDVLPVEDGFFVTGMAEDERSVRLMKFDWNGELMMTTNVNELLNPEGIHVYPNPASDILNINLDRKAMLGGKFQLVDQLGQVVLQRKLIKDQTALKLPASLKSGLYYFFYKEKNGTSGQGKLVIQK